MVDEMKQLIGLDRTRARRGVGFAVAAAMMASLAMGGGALAQSAEAPEDLSAWAKICNTDPKSNKEICVIQQSLRTDRGQLLSAIAIYEVTGEKRKKVRVMVPPGFLIQPGVRLRVDKDKDQELKYQICIVNGCFAELAADSTYIDKMKKGNNLTVTVLNPQGKPRSFKLTLAGFTAAYDGKGLNPAEAERLEEKLQEKVREYVSKEKELLKEAQKEAQRKAAE